MSPDAIGLKATLQKFIEESIGTTQYNVLPLAGDASSRRYYRIVFEEDSCVLMEWEPFVDDGNYPFLNIQAHLKKHGVRVPNVIATAPVLGAALLEDLGDLTLERKFWENQNQNLAIPFYKQAIDQLLQIHYPATADKQSGCVAFKTFFNTEKLMWEMHYGRDHLLEKMCKIEMSDEVRKELDIEFSDICMALDAEDKYICHRDYHSRNVMLKLGKAYVIDFQDARMGPIQYDLVSLVHDSYVDLNESSRNEILDYYLLKSKEMRGSPINRDRFYQVMRTQVLQRCFKACGSFASFYNMREDTRYLKHLNKTLQTVTSALESFPQYRVFKGLILDNDLINKDFKDPTTL